MPLFGRKEDRAAPVSQQGIPPNYQARCAFIGSRLDDERARAVVLLEINGNYIARFQKGAGGPMTTVEFLQDDIEGARPRTRGKPGSASYEAILGWIGRRLDQRVADNIVLIQTRSGYQIIGWKQGHAGEQLAYVPFEEAIDNSMVHQHRD